MREVFEEFVSARYIAELQRYWRAYAQIEMPLRATISEILLAADTDPYGSEEDYRVRIERRFRNAFQRELQGADPTRGYADLYREHLRNVRNIEAIRRVEEDRVAPPSDVLLCLDLLVDGCQGYWKQNSFELMAEFRREFINGSRKAFVLADDGSMPAIPPEWWRGKQATEAMESLEFDQPAGFIVERALSPHQENTAEQRIEDALQWLRDHGERVKDLADEERMEQFQEEAGTRISPDGWRRAKDRFLTEQPQLRRAFTRSGPRRKRGQS